MRETIASTLPFNSDSAHVIIFYPIGIVILGDVEGTIIMFRAFGGEDTEWSGFAEGQDGEA